MNFLESNGVTIHVDNGALINFKALGEQSGIVSGCAVTNNSGKVRIAKGTMAIRGFRVEFEYDEDVYDMNSYQTSDTSNYLVILKISTNFSQRASSAEFVVKRESSGLTQQAIETGITGVYEYPLARFVKSNGTISSFTVLATTISPQSFEIATVEEVKAALGIS